MKKALLLVPHQDDETDLAGNIIDVIKEKFDLYVLYGSLDIRDREGRIRVGEAYKACAGWRIDKEHITFLRYPDTPNKAGSHFFTRERQKVVKEIEEFIKSLKPDIIFATDFDSHSDHRMLSLAFEEAMGKLLKSERNYTPIVLKGFCYETAFYGPEDYLASKPGKSLSKFDILSNASLEWNARLSIPSDEKPGVIWSRKAYKALAKHKSQYAVLHAKSIINADNVFWSRRTDNLMLQAKILAELGDASKLNDFMIIDTDDIITVNPRKIDYSRAVWRVEGISAEILIKWDRKNKIDRLIFHGNPNISSEKKVNIQLKTLDKTIYEGEIQIKAFGRATNISFREVETDSLVLKLVSNDKCIELSEIEAFYGDEIIPEFVDNEYEIPGKDTGIINIVNDIGYRWIVLATKIKRKINNLTQKIAE